jgi:tripartite-type tricarboxylate transporter receptor subunit TctC
LSGNIDFYFGNTSVLLASDRTKITLLAVGTPNRVASAPEIPTISESMPGIEFASWNGFFVPKGTPAAMTEKLRAAIVELVSTPEMQDRLNKLGIVPGGQTAAQVAAAFAKDREMFTEAIAAAGIKRTEPKQ